MEGNGIHWSSVISGLVGAVIAMLMVMAAKQKGRSEEGRQYLEFGLFFKVVALLFVPFFGVVLYAVSQSYQGQEVASAMVACGFFAAAVFFPYQAFFIEFSYDKEFIYFSSPIAGDNQIPWDNLQKVGYSWLLQADYIVVADVGRIWCSNMLHGYADFMLSVDEHINKSNMP